MSETRTQKRTKGGAWLEPNESGRYSSRKQEHRKNFNLKCKGGIIKTPHGAVRGCWVRLEDCRRPLEVKRSSKLLCSVFSEVISFPVYIACEIVFVGVLS